MLRGHLLAQVAVGRGDEPHVDRDVVVGADAPDLARARARAAASAAGRAAARRSRRGTGAAVGRLEHALARRTAPVKAPRSWPNSSLSSRLRRHRAAVDDHERLVAARAAAVDRLGGDLLAGAGLALEQDGRVAGRRLAEHVEHRLHRRRAPDHAAEALFDASRVRPESGGIQAHRAAADVARRAHRGDPTPSLRTSTVRRPSLTGNALYSSDIYSARVRVRAASAGGYPLDRAAIVAAPSRPGCAWVTT